MPESDKRATNAGDSAPGVDDGPARNAAPDHRMRAGGRGVWIGIVICILILIAIFFAHPVARGPAGQMVAHGQTQADLAQERPPAQSGRGPG